VSPKLVILETVSSIDMLIKQVEQAEYVAYDCETTGLTTSHEIIGVSVCFNEDTAYYAILAKWDPINQTLDYLPTKEAVTRLLEVLKHKQLIMHNGVFDCQMAQAFFNTRLIDALHTDTMVLAHLLDENRRVGLKELAKQYFGEDATEEQELMKASVIENGGEWTIKNKDMYKADSSLLAYYGAKDAYLTYMLFLILVQELYEQGLETFFYEEESMPLLRLVTYELNTVGLAIDTKKLTALKKTLEAECLEARNFIYTEIAEHIKEQYPGDNKKTTFNIGSNVQMSWLLFGKLGLEFGNLTAEGKTVCRALGMAKLPYTPSDRKQFIELCLKREGQVYVPKITINGKTRNAKKIKAPWSYTECNDKILSKYAPYFKWIQKLLEYKKTDKILTTYVEGIGSRVSYGVIKPSFKQTGTTSGRYSSSNPNFQNLPRDDKRIKECVISRPGKVFVGADYSQLEPRVFAFMSQDVRLMAAFEGEDDFYSVIGMEVYGKYDCVPRKDGSPNAFGIKYKKLRDLSKVIALASTYGATAHQLASTTKKSIDATQEDIDSYFEKFPDVKKMMTSSHEMAKRDGQVVNLFGRPRRIPKAKDITAIYGRSEHADLPYEARTILNLSVNHRIQGTAASIVNRAAIGFKKNTQEVGIECNIVVQVHDSLVVECDAQDAENISLLLQDAMENTVHLPGVKLEAIPKIGINLSEV